MADRDEHPLYVRGPEFARRARDYIQKMSREIEAAHGVAIHVRADFFVRNEVPPHEYLIDGGE